MSRRTSPAWGVVGLAAIALAAGAVGYRLLATATLTQATPAYSSVRTDPRGTSVLFGALQRAGLTVARGYEPDSLARLAPAGAVAFVLAPEAWENGLADQLDRFAQAGGVVVLAEPPRPPAVAAEASAELVAAPETGLAERLGAQLETASRAGGRPASALVFADPVAATAPPGAAALPLQAPQTSLKLSPAWRAVYTRGGKAYLAMRGVGRGRVILASEATFLSNDSLAHAADPVLLSWLIGGRRTVWVDETLHGLQQVRGVAWLLQRYGLRAGLVWLLVALTLMAWGSATSLERPPAPAGEVEDMAAAAGGGTSGGYVRLLRRSIPLELLLRRCRQQLALTHATLAAALPALPPVQGDARAVVAWYEQVRQLVQAGAGGTGNEDERV